MAMQAEESAAPSPDPQVVGNVFMDQYYNYLSKSPELVHKFYEDSSVIGRPNSEGGMSSASTLDGINKMILSLDYKNCVIEILTVDAQESFKDGVTLLVTGFFTGKDHIRRKFTQSFFLVPQHNSKFFVLNDIFRYVDGEASVNEEISDANDEATTAPLVSYPEQTNVSDVSDLANGTNTLEVDEDLAVENLAKESDHPLENGSISSSEKEVVVEEVVSAAQNDASPASKVVASNVQEDAPKKSYASVANELNLKKQPFQQRVSPAKPVKQLHAAAAPIPSPRNTGSPVASGNNVAEQNNNSIAVKGCSIFVANLPMDATVEQLTEVFEKIGPIKRNGVQVRSYKIEKNCFGFVEFESPESVQKAIEVSSVMIGNRKAHIEEKKANNNGEKSPSRKGSSRNDNFRSRGNFGGGRGYGRNDFENQSGVLGRARGNNGRDGEANKKVHQNGGARGPRQAQTPAGKN